MTDIPLKPAGGTFGWLVTVERNKGQRAERYYVAIADELAAASKVRQTLRLKEPRAIRGRRLSAKQELSLSSVGELVLSAR